MHRPASLLLALLVVIAAFVPAGAAADAPAQRVIVVLRDPAAASATTFAGTGTAGATPTGRKPARTGRVTVAAQVRSLGRAHGFRPDHVYHAALRGFAARLTLAQVGQLQADPTVAAVLPDRPITLERGELGTSGGVVATDGAGPQRIPTGIRRIHADTNPIAAINGDGGRVDADVAVLDSGIADHPDLNIAGGLNCTDAGGKDGWNTDALGHGTHVAGTIGALDNGFGVVGVAPGVRLWSVKIIGDDDHGFESWAVCGLDWAASVRDAAGKLRIEAVNMSVGGPLLYPDTPCGRGTSDVYHQAVCRVLDAGIPVLVAAGNNSRNADDFRPSGYDEAITVAALADFDGLPGGKGSQSDICPWYSTDRDDTFADFSDFGPAVDVIAPGKCIYSTYKGGRYAWMSGTSMATPHVTGAVILYRLMYPDATPHQIEAALRASGTLDWRTGTDPDGQPDRLLDVAGFMPPPEFRIDATDPTGFLPATGSIQAPAAITRINGHREPIVLSGPKLPDGITVDAGPLRGTSDTILVRSRGLTQSGPVDITVRADDGLAARIVHLHLEIDAEAPVVTLDTPDLAGTGTAIVADPGVRVTWTAADAGGSALAKTTLDRISAPIPAPGTCDAAVYGDPVSLPADPGRLDAPDARCTRWIVTARDGAGNKTVKRTTPVLVDTTPPGAVRITGVTGDAAWATPDGATVWVQPETSGPLTLTPAADDPQSGVTGVRADGSALTAGWALTSGAGPVPQLTLTRTAPLADATLPVRALDGAGLTGPRSPIALRVDGHAPAGAAWLHPVAGDGPVSASWLTLDWSPGTDDGAGVAPAALVARQVAPVSAAGDCTGVTFEADGVATTMTSGTAVSGLRDNRCYRFVLRTLDRVGNRSAAVTSAPVLVDATPPTVGEVVPAPRSLTFDGDGSVRVAFTAADLGGSGVARTWLQRASAKIVTAGACPDAGYVADGPRATVTGPITAADLAEGRCYRWTIGARDVAGNGTTAATGSVLVDRTAPGAPAVTVSGDGVAWDAAGATAWFRSDRTGTATVAVTGTDAASGVAAILAGGPAATGWTDPARSTGGRSANLTYAWDVDAAARSIKLQAKDAAGLTGAPTVVRFSADPDAPVVTLTEPPADQALRPGDRTIAWTDADDASGIDPASRRLALQVADAAAADSCTDVTWGDPVDVAIDGRSATVTLRDGTCVRWTVAVRDRVGHRTSVTSAARLVDGSPPVVSGVEVGFRGTSVDARGRAPVRVRWTMRDADGESLTAAARASTDDGTTWKPLDLADPRIAQADLAMLPGRSLRVAVRAIDGSGNRASWLDVPSLVVATLDDADPALSWTGRWKASTVPSALGRTIHASATPGASVSATVTGRAVALVARLVPGGGLATVRVDGKVVARVSLAARHATDRKIVFSTRWPDAGEHRLEMRVSASRPGAVPIDALLVLR
ncbi:MAG: S8 family serine peptidase [Chloroflexota bacterium]